MGKMSEKHREGIPCPAGSNPKAFSLAMKPFVVVGMEPGPHAR
jgi:hypothetical protein